MPNTLITPSSTWEEFKDFLFQKERFDRTKDEGLILPEEEITLEVFNRFSPKPVEELFREIQKGVHLGAEPGTGIAMRFSRVSKGILTDGEGTAWLQERRI